MPFNPAPMSEWFVVNPNAPSARSGWLFASLFSVILFITLVGPISMLQHQQFLLGGRALTPTRITMAILVVTVPVAGLLGAAFGLITPRRTAMLAVLVALPPTMAHLVLVIWASGTPTSYLWKVQYVNILNIAVFFPLFVFTASLVGHLATATTPKRRSTIGMALFAGLTVASLVLTGFMVLLALGFVGMRPAIFVDLILFVVAVVLAIMFWRKALTGVFGWGADESKIPWDR